MLQIGPRTRNLYLGLEPHTDGGLRTLGSYANSKCRCGFRVKVVSFLAVGRVGPSIAVVKGDEYK